MAGGACGEGGGGGGGERGSGREALWGGKGERVGGAVVRGVRERLSGSHAAAGAEGGGGLVASEGPGRGGASGAEEASVEEFARGEGVPVDEAGGLWLGGPGVTSGGRRADGGVGWV